MMWRKLLSTSSRRVQRPSARSFFAVVGTVVVVVAQTERNVDDEEGGFVIQNASRSDDLYTHCQSLVSSKDVPNGGGGGVFLRKHHDTLDSMINARAKRGVDKTYNINWQIPLGAGAFGEVYLATERSTGMRYALKTIDKKCTDESTFQREMDALLKVHDNGGHPHICGMKEYFDDASGGTNNNNTYQIVLDLITGGEMFDHLTHRGAYSEADASRLLREITSALAFLHGIGIVHTDLKPENLMLSSKFTDEAVIKLVDFGCACDILSEDEQLRNWNASATPSYCPPEILKVLDEEGPSVIRPSFDMWSVGVIAYIMLVGRHPFDLECKSTEEEIEEQILSGKMPPLRNSEYTSHLSEDAKSVLEKLLVWDPDRRISADELLDHPWIQGKSARTKKMDNSDNRLSTYRKHEKSVMKSFFKGMLRHNTNKVKNMSLLERAFSNLDPNQRGYISTKELHNDTTFLGSDARLSMSEVTELLSERMTNRYYPKNSIIYQQGQSGDTMYFVNSGSVEITNSDGYQKERKTGEFFGEDALLHEKAVRQQSVKASTPVHVIEITRDDFEAYLSDDPDVRSTMAETVQWRKRENTKTILNLQADMKPKSYKRGDVIFSAGQEGNVLYILEQGNVDIFVNGQKVRSLRPGEMTGEHAAFYCDKPYNVTAVCKSDECQMQTITDIHQILAKSDPSLRESFRHVILYRDFKKALVHAIDRPFPTTQEELKAAFQALAGRDNVVTFDKLRNVVRKFDAHYSKADIEEMLLTLDLTESGFLTYDDFQRMYGDDKDM